MTQRVTRDGEERGANLFSHRACEYSHDSSVGLVFASDSALTESVRHLLIRRATMEPTGTPRKRNEASVLLASRQDPRAARILARTLYRDMTENGLTQEQILAVTTELIGLVTNELASVEEEVPQG